MAIFCFKTAGIQYVQKFVLNKRTIGKSEGKRTHVRSRLRWEDNIKVHLKEIKSENVKWILNKHKGIY